MSNITQEYAPTLQPGDVVVMACGMRLQVGVCKGHSKAGNIQVVIPLYTARYSNTKHTIIKTANSNHTQRIAIINLKDLPTDMHLPIQELVKQYKQ